MVKQAQRTGEFGRLPALLDVELRENVLEMRLHGLGRDIERTSELPIRLVQTASASTGRSRSVNEFKTSSAALEVTFPLPKRRRCTRGAKLGRADCRQEGAEASSGTSSPKSRDAAGGTYLVFRIVAKTPGRAKQSICREPALRQMSSVA